MPDLLDTGSEWLGDRLREHASRPVVYRRGAGSVTVPAVIGRTRLKLSDGAGGIRIEWTDRDFLILAADLVLDGSPALPQRGDKVLEQAGSQTLVYEVMAPGGEPPWRWSDVFRRLLRIHTKLVETL